MKKILLCLLALLCLCAPAQAQNGDDFFTRSDNFYYHFNPRCGGEEKRVPISAEAAKAFGKDACPVCIPAEDDGAAPEAAFRGGTIAVKFSDAWLKEQQLTGVFGFMGEHSYAGAQAHRLLRQYLHGDSYNAFILDWTEDAIAEGRANIPDILPEDDALVMNRRHIGSDWYIIVRPGQKFDQKWDMYWRVSSYALRLENDALYTEFDQQTVEDHYRLKLQSLNPAQPVYNRNSGGLAIEVYEALGGSIAVIREENADADRLENVYLSIDGRRDGVELTGYMDGSSAIYCCMITDAELEALQENARAQLFRAEQVRADIYRTDDAQQYAYYTFAGDELLFTIEKSGSADPADDDFRMIYSGEPDCFALYQGDHSAICAYSGDRVVPEASGMHAERLTPLAWDGQKGVFLAEHHPDKDYSGDDCILTGGVKFDHAYALSAEKDPRQIIWLCDQDGKALTRAEAYVSAALREDGSIALQTAQGERVICDFLLRND